MRRVVLHMMMSLDGQVAAADHDESWMVAPDHERDAASLAVAEAVDCALIGHGVYPDMAGYWPTAEGDTDVQRRYVERVNALPKLVVSSQDVELAWNATALVVTEKDFADRIRRLKQSEGGDIAAWGGGSLVRELARHDLIDEYQLFIEPIALGRGTGLFDDIPGWRRLRLREARSFSTGVVFVRYTPRSSGHGGEGS